MRFLRDRDSFEGAFQEIWQRLESSFLKFESRQFYQESDESLELFLCGKREQAEALLSSEAESEQAIHEHVENRGARFVRVRPYVLPLSPYLQWELLTYQISAKQGERINLFDEQHIAAAKQGYELDDFMIFDDRTVLVHNYTDAGELVGGWEVSGIERVQPYRHLFDSMIGVAEPLDSFLDRFPHLRLGNA